MRLLLAVSLLLIASACQSPDGPIPQVEPPTHAAGEGLERATFAGGCFWCMQPPFDELDGVVSTVVGYTDGVEQNPTYAQVSSGQTSHTEAIEVRFDPDVISYAELLAVFWRNIDPTTRDRQFVDVGSQYRAGIYYHDEQQRELALASKVELDASGRFSGPIVTDILAATTFWKAEEYHQDYYKKNPTHYYRYRRGSGRDAYLDRVWADER